MAIPKTISRQNVIDAIQEIKVFGIPRQRLPRKWYLSYKGSKYPTKLAISLAHKMAKGRPLDPSKFTGGNESNSFLRRLGFSVCPYTPTEAVTDSIVKELSTAKLCQLSDWKKCVEVVPKESGVYAWYFEGLPLSGAMSTSSVLFGPCRRGGLNFKGCRIPFLCSQASEALDKGRRSRATLA